jgi:NAD(P)-dependent dehydrogenase (short-subunit alcohol dehydrogenase family)
MAKGLFDLTGKVAVVTGGNSGIGLGFARGIAKQGGSVVIWGRNAEKNVTAQKALESLLPSGSSAKVVTAQVDVASEQQIIAGYDAVIKQFGRVDCVVANAGLPPPRSNSTLDQSTKDYLNFIDVSMHGSFYTLREGARHMVKRAEAGEPGGSLIFCGSLSMFKGLPGKIPYAASKAAMGAAVRAMAVEFGKYGIRANTVAPGYIKTGMTGESTELSQIDKYFASKTPIPRPGYPADFEGIAAYLASDASSFHTGDTLIIDGASLINL